MLDQFIDCNDEFLSFSQLRSRLDLSASVKWKYLQLQDLLVSKYSPAALSVSEFPLLLETVIESMQKMKPRIFVYKYLISIKDLYYSTRERNAHQSMD